MKNKLNRLTESLARSARRRPVLKIVSLGLLGAVLVVSTLCVTGFGNTFYRLGGAW